VAVFDEFEGVKERSAASLDKGDLLMPRPVRWQW
jgi:hypothetical protein